MSGSPLPCTRRQPLLSGNPFPIRSDIPLCLGAASLYAMTAPCVREPLPYMRRQLLVSGSPVHAFPFVFQCGFPFLCPSLLSYAFRTECLHPLFHCGCLCLFFCPRCFLHLFNTGGFLQYANFSSSFQTKRRCFCSPGLSRRLLRPAPAVTNYIFNHGKKHNNFADPAPASRLLRPKFPAISMWIGTCHKELWTFRVARATRALLPPASVAVLPCRHLLWLS